MEKTLFQNILGIFSEYRFRFFKSFVLLVISNFLLVANPLVIRQALLSIHQSEQTTLLGSLLGSSILPWGIFLVFITTVSAFFKYWMRMGFIGISRDVEKEVREKIFIRIQSQSRAFFDHHGIGELLSRLTNDISLYRDLLGPGIMYPLFVLTIVTPGILALFYISTPLAAVTLFPLIIIPLFHAAVRQKSYRLSLEVQSALGQLSNVTQEHYSGIRIIKSYAIEQPTYQQFCKLCSDFASLNFKLSSLQGLFVPLFALLTKITTIFILLSASYIIFYGWGMLSTADFVSFMWIQSYIFFPVLMLGWVLPVYDRGRAAYARLMEIYQEPIEVKDNPTSFLRIPHEADIEFKNMNFSYPNTEKSIFTNFNLFITGGSFVGITGPVGAGKSTLFNLINREYEVPQNSLFIGDHEIHEYSLSAFRSQMVTVEQVSFLFSRSVAENVRFGREDASNDEMIAVAEFADLHDTVMDFPEKYDTIVGERGVTLSGGQKQRVAIARALLVNRSILLLDDIFSAVDAATEKRIFSAIKQNFSDRTILLITHRVSILEKLDRVIYLMNGQVVEDGSPEELLKRKGHFSALSDLQHLIGDVEP